MRRGYHANVLQWSKRLLRSIAVRDSSKGSSSSSSSRSSSSSSCSSSSSSSSSNSSSSSSSINGSSVFATIDPFILSSNSPHVVKNLSKLMDDIKQKMDDILKCPYCRM